VHHGDAEVTKLSCEVQVLKCDNIALKLQLSDLRQIYAPPPSISTEVASSTHDGAARTYRDVLSSGGGHPASTTKAVSATLDIAARTCRDVSSSGGGHPASTAVSSGINWHATLPEYTVLASGNQAADGFIFLTVLRKRKGNHPASSPSGVPNPPRRPRTPLFGNKSSPSLSTVPKRVRTKALLVSRLSPDVSSADVEQSLKDQSELPSLACTKLKTKFNSYSSFHIAVSEDDFHLK
jgi:hypothetical protein